MLKQNLPFPAVVGRICPAPLRVAVPPQRGRGADLHPPLAPLCRRRRHRKRVSSGRAASRPPARRSPSSAPDRPGWPTLTTWPSRAMRSPSLKPCRKPGGMLRYGIPEYRLPKKVLDAELRAALGHGRRAEDRQCPRPRLHRSTACSERRATTPSSSASAPTRAWPCASRARILPGVIAGGRFPARGRARQPAGHRREGRGHRRRFLRHGRGARLDPPGRQRGHGHLPPHREGDAGARDRGPRRPRRGRAISSSWPPR